MSRWYVAFAVSSLSLALVSASVAAPARPWAQPNGSAANFDYFGGGDDQGRFGDPIIVGDSFVFFPSNFRAQSSGAINVNDRMEVRVRAHPNFVFTGVRIQELGDWQITGSGQVSVSGTLQLTDLINRLPNGFPRVRRGNLVGNPPMPINQPNSAGQWSADAFADLSTDVPEWTELNFILTNELVAIADPGSSSSMEKTFAGGAVAVTFIPEPGTIGLAGLGALALIRRRKN